MQFGLGGSQQAANKNLTQGQDMTIVVRGQSVCSYCQSDLGDMANLAGLNKLTVYDTATGNVYIWVRNSEGAGGTWQNPPPELMPQGPILTPTSPIPLGKPIQFK